MRQPRPARFHRLHRHLDPGRGGGPPGAAGRWSPWPPGATGSCSGPSASSYRPGCVSLARAEDAAWLARELSYAPVVLHGMDGLMACALQAGGDTVVAAVVGAAGLASVEAALRSGRRVCVANKESLVVGGALMRQALAEGGGELLPIDSEHCALHQLLAGRAPARGAGDPHHRQRRPVPGLGPGAHPGRHRGGGAQPSHLEDGSEDHHRFRHAHEQGPGGDRGLGPVRPCRRPDPGDRPPPEPGARHGRASGTAPTSCRCAPTT